MTEEEFCKSTCPSSEHIALAVYTRSPAAYEALKSFGILQLPSRSTLQSYTGAFLHDPGAYNHCIAGQVSQYILFKAECEKQGIN